MYIFPFPFPFVIGMEMEEGESTQERESSGKYILRSGKSCISCLCLEIGSLLSNSEK